MTTANETNITNIHAEAMIAAEEAVQKELAKWGGQDAGSCGFAWVKVYGVKLNTKMGKVMKSLGFSKSYNGGIEFWNPSRYRGQNIDIKEAGANAYAAVLRNYGINAYANSRLD